MTTKKTEQGVTASAGRKSNAEAKDLQSLITKSEWEMRKNDALCCNDLAKLYALQREIAFGVGALGKQASVTNRKSAIENMIVRGEAYATGEAPLLNIQEGEPQPEEEFVTETKQVSNGEPVMSFADKKKAWQDKQADKKEG